MKTKLNALASITFAFALAGAAGPTLAQPASTNTSSSGGGHTTTDKSIEYHGGLVSTGIQDVYFIFYGCGVRASAAARSRNTTISPRPRS